ncbi:uncharacterized protein V6R79_024788 [Siganus canaliculatus]
MKLAVFVSLLVIVPFYTEAASCIGKNVEVWVANGNDLTGDGLQHPDPYVIVKIGSDEKRTRTIYSNANPVWWQRLQFNKVSSNTMVINIWEADSGLRGDDDHLGTCVESLVAGGDKFRTIKCNARDSGFVVLHYKCQ